MQSFYFWVQPASGYSPRVVAYIYDGCSNQQGHTLDQWKERVKRYLADNGAQFIGEATADEYVNHYIIRNEHGYRCMVEGQFAHLGHSLDNAKSYMESIGLTFDVLTVSDSGQHTWWYTL